MRCDRALRHRPKRFASASRVRDLQVTSNQSVNQRATARFAEQVRQAGSLRTKRPQSQKCRAAFEAAKREALGGESVETDRNGSYQTRFFCIASSRCAALTACK